jgi:uncharacterized membrane protein YeaQ/YmgE (transglycosylase-associated protein family)
LGWGPHRKLFGWFRGAGHIMRFVLSVVGAILVLLIYRVMFH